MFLSKTKSKEALSYRQPMQVREACCYHHSSNAYAICPRCGAPMEREYQSYCDRCGQALRWINFENLKIIFLPHGK